MLDVLQGSEFASGLLKLHFHGFKRDIQEGYSILYKLRNFSYSENIHGNTAFKLTKD